MICPHCHHTIEEQETYLMSQRIPKDEPLPPGMKLLGIVGCAIVGFLVCVYVFWLIRTHAL